MKPSSARSEKLRRLLRIAYRERDQVTVGDQWARQTLDRIHQLTEARRPSTIVSFWELYFWRWFTVGGMATAALVLMILNIQWIPDGALWSFLFYETETLNMMQAYLY